REVIEHPKSIPSEIKAHLDLTSGRDRGRIYRVVPQGYRQRPLPQLSRASIDELVKTLEHRNGWHRDTATRLLYERKDRAAVEPLKRLVSTSELPEARIQGLYVLGALGGLTEEIVLERLADDHPRVRQHAIRLAEEELKAGPSKALVAALSTLAADDDPEIRYQLAFTLAELPLSERVPVLAAILKRDLGDRWIEAAAFSSLDQSAGPLLAHLAKQSSITADARGRSLLAKVCQQ